MFHECGCLAGLTRLCWLDLVSSERMEEAALAHLSTLTKLHYLDIGPFGGLSDAALQALEPLHILQRICLRICREVSSMSTLLPISCNPGTS